MPLGELAHVLRHFSSGETDERLLVGPGTFDDAGVVRFAEDRALVQTVDFFPPIVDEPRAFGRIAAANALSDVYAMGGRPLSVLNVAGFPEGFDPAVITAIFEGAAEKVREAGAAVAGGHTIRSGGEVLFGMAVTGEVHPKRFTPNTNAKPGDLLYLTKPLGMGAATTGIKKGKLDEAAIRAAEDQMAALNARACEAMVAAGARCATDVTGYGLLGHARNIARGSEVTIQFRAAALPFFPASLELARKGVLSGGVRRNRQSFGSEVRVGPSVPPHVDYLCFDSETSGGLLIAISRERAVFLEGQFAACKVAGVRVGEVLPKGDCWIELE